MPTIHRDHTGTVLDRDDMGTWCDPRRRCNLELPWVLHMVLKPGTAVNSDGVDTSELSPNEKERGYASITAFNAFVETVHLII